jgi:acyl-CoA reductase-like NAD-dependent aldehyde dehydrogenase
VDVDNGDRLAQEEVFGPVIALMSYDTVEEAVRIANDSRYGLAGSVWTPVEERDLNIARQLVVGMAGANYFDADLGSPFGGCKESGVGREPSPEGIEPYLEYKSMYLSSRYLPSA